MELLIKIQSVYDVEKIYPICEKSKKLASLLNQKTFTKIDISKLKEIGFSFKVQEREI